MGTFLSIDIVGRSINLPQSNVLYPVLRVDRGWVERMGEEKGFICKMKKRLFSFLKI